MLGMTWIPEQGSNCEHTPDLPILRWRLQAGAWRWVRQAEPYSPSGQARLSREWRDEESASEGEEKQMLIPR